MEIDLTKVLEYSKDCLQNRAQMRSIMMDMYPGMTRDMNILLDVYESGVPRKIKNDGNITDAQYVQYVQKIVNDYGIQEQWAVIGLNAWIDVFLGEGTSVTINYAPSCRDTAGGNNTNSIANVSSKPAKNMSSMGKTSDYKTAYLSKGTVEISKYVGVDQADIVIPTEINGKKVLGIGEMAFYQCEEIQQVIIPEGVEYLKAGAFAECSNLKKIILPTTLENIGEVQRRTHNLRILRDYITRSSIKGIFEGTAINEIDLPNLIREIPENCFSGCKELRKVQFPDDLKLIGYGAFKNCKNITEIQLPSFVEEIGKFAFFGCTKLFKVEINDGLNRIEDEAFEKCTAIKEIKIPRTVQEFGDDIFKCGHGGNKKILIKCSRFSEAYFYAEKNNLQIDDSMG